MKNYSGSEWLTIEDFKQLQENPLPESRESVARKIGHHFDHSSQETAEYKIACEIAFHLQKDAEAIVRIALADSIHQSESAPKQLILLLAMDEEDAVALPILKESPLIGDGDLVALLPQIELAARLIAVAERKFISVTVSSMLAERNFEEVVVSLLANDSAIIDEEVILQISHKHARSTSVLNRMMKRLPMPTKAVNHMVQIQQSGGQENRTPSDMRSFSSLGQAELGDDLLTLMFLGHAPSDEACEHMVAQLERKKKVSATFMLLAMCLGHEHFFFTYMAHNTHLPRERVEELANIGELEFSLLMNKSSISSSLYPLMYHVYTGMEECLKGDAESGSKAFADQMIKCLIAAETKGVNFATTIGKPLAKALIESFA
ncbi:MAG: DUF2336 domain-containing protein [Rickettsiales bacterium]|nr:DUF2336 domain-containing protein [Rickettsiales bacterium]